MNKNSARKHETHFNEFEIDALASVFVRLNKTLDEFTRSELSNLLCLVYNLPHGHRDDKSKTLAAAVIASQTLSTVVRHEIYQHRKDSEFCEQLLLLVNGNPNAITYEEVNGLRGLLDALASFANGGVNQ